MWFFLSLSFFFASEPMHAAASKIDAIPKTFSSIQLESRFLSTWKGHFSAEKFGKKRNDTILLEDVKTKIRKTLALIPEKHIEALTSLRVVNETSKSRGLANSQRITLYIPSIKNDQELSSVFVHEMGHITDLGMMKGSGKNSGFFDGEIAIKEGDPSVSFYKISWKDASTLSKKSKREDFVSGYAMSNPFEDFAESYLFYRFHGEKFRSLTAQSPALLQKYRFLKTIVFENEEFQMEKAKPIVVANIWDATLLPISEQTLVGQK